MDQLIGLLIGVVIFAVIAYGLYWACTKFELPKPVLWLCGLILLVFLLYWISGYVGAGTGIRFPHRG